MGKTKFPMAILTLLGRKDYAISLYGTKISPEMIQLVIEKSPLFHSFKISAKKKEVLIHLLMFSRIS